MEIRRSEINNHDTIVTLNDGRIVRVNAQYGAVDAHPHAADCEVPTRMGARCACWPDVDRAEILTAVREWRSAQREIQTEERITARRLNHPIVSVPMPMGLCPRCETYCEGDCQMG